MNISPAVLSLLSVAVGAILGAAFSYIVQALLARARQTHEEANTAFVHFCRIAPLLAIGKICKAKEQIVKDFATNLAPLAPALSAVLKQDVTLTQMVVALVHHWGCNDEEKKRWMQRILSNSLAYAEETSSYSMPPEQLAKLPRKAIAHYATFAEVMDAGRSDLKSLLAFAEGKRDLSPDDLYRIWLHFEGAYSKVLKLSEALRVHGRISETEADEIISLHEQRFAPEIASVQEAGPKLKAIVEVLQMRKREVAAPAASA